jgi:hypothetical protein
MSMTDTQKVNNCGQKWLVYSNLLHHTVTSPDNDWHFVVIPKLCSFTTFASPKISPEHQIKAHLVNNVKPQFCKL